jgi:hypothetical protein
MLSFNEFLNEANDMTKLYDGFVILNKATGKTTKYPYIKGKKSNDVEDAAILEQMKLHNLERAAFSVTKLIPKGEY